MLSTSMAMHCFSEQLFESFSWRQHHGSAKTWRNTIRSTVHLLHMCFVPLEYLCIVTIAFINTEPIQCAFNKNNRNSLNCHTF